ncbi:MAG: SDR family oxidoreductase [Kofleriaceae bacterium]
MLKLPGKVALLTGASQGIGASTARALSGLGVKVYGASRSVTAGQGADYYGVPMDVTKEDSVVAGLAAVIEREGRLDAVINCAGFAVAGPIEEISVEDAQRQFDTNFFGAARVCRAALPHLRRHGAGLIVNIGSLAATVPLPYQAYYSASKAALALFSEALRLEVARDGINVVLIEPGDIKTSFTGNREQPSALSAHYEASYQRVLEVVRRDEGGAVPPERVAAVVVRALSARTPSPRYGAGMISQRAAVGLAAVLPRRTFQWLLAKYYRV